MVSFVVHLERLFRQWDCPKPSYFVFIDVFFCKNQDANSKWIFTTDEGKRGGKTLHLKNIVDKAVEGVACVEKVFMFKVTGAEVPVNPTRDVLVSDMLPLMRPYCPCERMDSEVSFFPPNGTRPAVVYTRSVVDGWGGTISSL